MIARRWCKTAWLVSLAMAMLVLPGLWAPVRAQQPNPPPERAQLRARLLDAVGGRARTSDRPETGVVRFFGTDAGAAVPRPAGLPANAAPEAAARAFLTTYGPLFGVADQARQLRVDRTRDAGEGRSSVHFQQMHDGIPVIAGELVVNVDRNRNVLSTNGELAATGPPTTAPALTAADAQQQAVTVTAKAYDLDPGTLTASTPALWVYDPALLGDGSAGRTTLVWRASVRSPDHDINELVLVDATTGGIALHFNQVPHAKTRRICDRNNVVNPDPTCVAPYTRQEGGAATGIVDVDTVYTYSGHVYDFFSSNFGRDSLNGAGLPLVSTVRFCETASACPYSNAFWDDGLLQMTFGQGMYADDVVGHEFSHGFTGFESNLFYYYQAGAINESLSDVFGELVDLTNGAGNDTAGVRWIQGEDLAVGPVRNMANPPAYGDPDAMDSANYQTSSSDNGGVHTNGGVNNKAAFLMADGGTFNGITVSGIGLTKMAHVYYEANVNLLTSGSDYQDLYDYLRQACTNKIGVAGITTANCAEVKKALDATKMYLTAPSTRAEAPVCGAGETATTLFADDMENQASGNWVAAGTGSGGWQYALGYATSGIRDLWGPDPSTTSNRTMARTAGVVPPAGKTTYLRFRHSFEMETNYDGGIVEYSTNGGSTWTDAGSLFVNNGYNRTNTNGPFAGRAVFSDRSLGYGSSRLNLTSLAGQSVRYRFRLATDSSVGDLGWDVDDVRVYTCTTGSTATEPPADFNGDGTTDFGIYRPSNGGWYVALAGGGSTSASWGAPGDVPVPGDYNGDAKADFGIYRPSNGGWYVALAGGGTTSATWGVSTDVPVPGDYDGDGKTDFGVYRPSNGGWYVALAGGGSTSATWGGAADDLPVPADYNGDGKTDFGIYRPSTGGWYVALAGGGATSATWGTAGDIPVPGDYNGDAKADFGIYRPSTGGWYVALAGGGATSATWGAAGDIPVPGDYNGDAKADFGIYRPSTGGWYVALAGGGATSATWGASTDIPLPLPYAVWQRFFGGP